MQVNISGHHVEVTDALRDYVSSKLGRVMRHFDNLTDVHCILTVEKLQQKAEATLHLSRSTIHAEAVDGDMYAAIDLMSDRLDRQVKKHKEKLRDHHQRDATKQRFA